MIILSVLVVEAIAVDWVVYFASEAPPAAAVWIAVQHLDPDGSIYDFGFRSVPVGRLIAFWRFVVS